MGKWLFSLLILVALGSGVLAGTPLRSGADECPMSQAAKCCKPKAAGQATPTEITRANLCRTLVCEQSASSASSIQLPQLSTLIAAVLYFRTLKFSPSKQAMISKANFSESTSYRCKNPLFLQLHAFRI